MIAAGLQLFFVCGNTEELSRLPNTMCYHEGVFRKVVPWVRYKGNAINMVTASDSGMVSHIPDTPRS